MTRKEELKAYFSNLEFKQGSHPAMAVTYERMEQILSTIQDLTHDLQILKDAMQLILKLEQIYPDGSKVAAPASYIAEDVLSKLKVNPIKVGATICKHGNPDPMFCKECK